MSTSTKKDLSLMHKIIMLLLMFGMRFLPPFGEMTVEGMQVLGVFLGAVYGWIAMSEILLPSILGIVALLYSPAITGAEFLAGAFGTQVFLMVLCMSVLAALMVEKDLSNVIVS